MNKNSHSYPGYNHSVIDAANKALQKGLFSGIEMKNIAEKKIAEFMHSTYALLTGTGYSALQVALIAAGVKSGHYVVLPSVTCPSVYHAICSVGAIPLVTDVGSDLPLITPELAELAVANVNFQGVAIIPQMFGIRQNLKSFAEKGFFVIEDAAQAFSKGCDKNANITVVSFSPTKLVTMGYGGAVILDDNHLYMRAQCFTDPDHSDRFVNLSDIPFRIHSPVTDFQSAMLIAQLDRYEDVIQIRNKIVCCYDEYLNYPHRLCSNVPFRYQLILPHGGSVHIAECLRSKGIGAWPLGSQLLHEVFNIQGQFTNAENWRDRVLSLPLHEQLTVQEVEEICKAIKEYL